MQHKQLKHKANQNNTSNQTKSLNKIKTYNINHNANQKVLDYNTIKRVPKPTQYVKQQQQ